MTPAASRQTRSRHSRLLLGVLVCLTLSAATFGVTLAGINTRALSPLAASGILLATQLAGLGLACALISFLHLPRPVTARTLLPGIAAAAASLFMSIFGLLIATTLFPATGRGRQIRHRGRLLLAGLEDNPDWAELALSVQVPDTLRPELARRWRENGRTEHASVAAFARLSLDLMAFGAPASLLADANRAARDEIRHAQLCFSLARALDGQASGAARFPAHRTAHAWTQPRILSLARLAVDSLVDGALLEGVSARVIARLAGRCQDPATSAVLREIAADEGRHAAHGWDVVSWCLRVGGLPVSQALRGALRAIPVEFNSTLPTAARDGSWEAWGVPGHELEDLEYQAARADLVSRVNVLIAQREAPERLAA